MGKYAKLIDEITYNSQKVLLFVIFHDFCSYSTLLINRTWSFQIIQVGMFELHCDELIRGLAKRADGLRSKLLQRMIKDHQVLNKRYKTYLCVGKYTETQKFLCQVYCGNFNFADCVMNMKRLQRKLLPRRPILTILWSLW